MIRRPATPIWLTVAALAITGCRGPGKSGPGADRTERQYKPLEQIPIAQAPAPPVDAQPASAPADAIRFYVDGRADLNSGKPKEAVDSFLRAATADPKSADVQLDLARAYEAVGDPQSAIQACDRASALTPNAIAPLLSAGRLLQQTGQPDAAVDYLHRALISPELTEDGQGVAVHLWLARALASAGYADAAIRQFNIVIGRLNSPTIDLRGEPSIYDVLRHPVILNLDLADLLESQQRDDQAVAILTRVAEIVPTDSDIVGRLVAELIKTGQPALAVEQAQKLVIADQAAADSIAVLTRACQAVNPPADPATLLLKISTDHPADSAIRAAAIDALTKSDRWDDALAFCLRCHTAAPADPSATNDLVKQFLHASRPVDAIAAVIDTAAADPDTIDRLELSWTATTRPGKRSLLVPADLAVLPVKPSETAARDWYLSRLFDDLHRKGESSAALTHAVSDRPVFPPAFRSALDHVMADPRQTSKWKADRAAELSRAAESAGEPWLAAELHGIAGKPGDAGAAFLAAQQMNPHSAEVRLQAANAAGLPQQIEFALWQNIENFPTFVGNYRALQAKYLADPAATRDELEQLAVVWSQNLPDDFGGPLLTARLAADRGDDAGAEKILTDLIDTAPGDPDIFDAARAFYSRVGKLETLARRLQSRLELRPRDVPVLAEVVTLFTSLDRAPEAVRVLDVSRASLVDNATGLYPLANLYSKAGQPATAVELLRDVLKLDPDFAAASNDLAFYLIDGGTDLPAAADLVAHALALEPDNPAFLDSLGWLQFKRGDYAAAVDTLRKAVGPAVGGEPTVLDHFGDALNRAGQPADARQAWTRALATLGTQPDAQPTLRLQLMQKIGKPATTRG